MSSLELLDVIQHAKPSIEHMDVMLTARSLRKAGGSLNNYSMAIGKIDAYCSGLQKKSDLLSYLRTHPNAEWHRYLEDVGIRLWEVFGETRGKWYPVGRKPIPSLAGLLIKPAIRGVWVRDGKAFPCLINARGSVCLEPSANRPFVARGIHEFHVRDEFGVAGGMIVDLGKDPATGQRANRVHYSDETNMMDLERFERILRNFNEALSIAGFQASSTSVATDLFRASSHRP